MRKVILALLFAITATFTWVSYDILSGNRLVSVAEKALETTVVIREVVEVDVPFFGTMQARVEGSGVIVSTDGYIVTAGHMFTDLKVKSISVELYNGDVMAAELIKVSDRADLALIRVFWPLKRAAILAHPWRVKVAQEIIVIGNPLSVPFTVTHGIISAVNRDINGYNLVQVDAPVNPGNSGGPVYNLRGDIVGIVSFLIPPVNAPIWTGLSFSVSSGQLIEFLVDCHVPRKWR